MLGVMHTGGLGGDGAKLGGHHPEIAALETGDDLPDEATFDSIGLAYDESAIHGVRS